MKNQNQTPTRRAAAFTLIELLVVIAVIAILAALIFPAFTGIKKNQKIKLAQAELAQLETAIEAYKAKRGTYPPDNPGNFVTNQLFFELKGTVLTNLGGQLTYVTLDGSGQIPVSVAAFQSAYGTTTGVRGFVNSSASAKGDDEKAAAQNFLTNLKPGQSGAPDMTVSAVIKVLSCSVRLEEAPYPMPNSDPVGLNPWRYVSTKPTNNVNSYDLWVDLVIGGKNYRVSNWSNKP